MKNELFGLLGTTDIYSVSDCPPASLSLPPTLALVSHSQSR